MFSSTFELITLAASNSLVIFCFCNLIIGILLVGGSKPKSRFDENNIFSSPSPTIANADDDRKPKTMISANHSVQKSNAAAEVSEVSCVNIVMVNDSEVKDEQDDELRKRVEEFIEKINEGWKAEKLRTTFGK